MSEPSPRRRIAGRALLGAAVLALPLTASISYAASEVLSEVPEVSEVPEAPELPAPPTAPDAPTPPAPPAPPEILTIDPDGETQVIESQDGRTVIIKRERSEDGETTTERQIKIIRRGDKMSAVEIEALEAGLRTAMLEADKQLRDLPTIMRNAMVNIDLNDGEGTRTILKMECRGNDDDIAKVEEGENGRSTVFLCHSRVMAQAFEGLKKTREDIARDLDMPEEMRERMLRHFDEMIEEWGKRRG